MNDVRVLETLAAVLFFLVTRVVIKNFIKRKTHMLEGHENLIRFVTSIVLASVVIYVLNVWGLLSELFGILTALGVVAVALIFTLKDVWISNVFAGVSLDKAIRVGTELEVDGKRGRIVDMTLTVTKMVTKDGKLVIVPNMKLKQDVVIVRIKK